MHHDHDGRLLYPMQERVCLVTACLRVEMISRWLRIFFFFVRVRCGICVCVDERYPWWTTAAPLSLLRCTVLFCLCPFFFLFFRSLTLHLHSAQDHRHPAHPSSPSTRLIPFEPRKDCTSHCLTSIEREISRHENNNLLSFD